MSVRRARSATRRRERAKGDIKLLFARSTEKVRLVVRQEQTLKVRANHVVAAGAADRCEVQLAYAIGVAEPVSVSVEAFGTGKVSDAKMEEAIREHFQLTPGGIIEALDLRKPVFRPTAAYGHFGRKEFSWESTDKAADIAQALGTEAIG